MRGTVNKTSSESFNVQALCESEQRTLFGGLASSGASSSVRGASASSMLAAAERWSPSNRPFRAGGVPSFGQRRGLLTFSAGHGPTHNHSIERMPNRLRRSVTAHVKR
jgi:hypothetical protein